MAVVEGTTPQPLAPNKLHVDIHVKFVLKLDENKEKMEYWTMQHLQVSGIYWGISALNVLGRLGDLDREKVLTFVRNCRNSDGGYGGNKNQDSHMLYTLSAVQVLCILDAFEEIDRDAVAKYVAARQKPDGSFEGDCWGEIDTRFSYIAMNCLGLLSRLDAIDVPKAMDFVLACQNWDGGFGVVPKAESHAAQVFCCVGALRIGNALHKIDTDKLGFWLAERQVSSGGLNGRPQKLADVCYSWWVISSLAMIDRIDWISKEGLIRYILTCQDLEDGGIADKPGNWPDVYHTFFGVAGLSLLGYQQSDAPLTAIDPTYAMPLTTLKVLGVKGY